MLALISSIPTTVREGFDVQDLPLRASTVSAEQISEVFGVLSCFNSSVVVSYFTSCPNLKDMAASRCRRRGGVLSSSSWLWGSGNNTYKAMRYNCCR